jgi:hypothetical protein
MAGLIVAAMVGLFLVAIGWMIEGHAYLPGLFLEVGISLVLVAPLLLLGRTLEQRIRVTEAVAESLADAVADARKQIRETVLRLDELGAATRERLQQERADAIASLRAVEQVPSYENVSSSVLRALRLNVIPPDGVRVQLPSSTLRLRFEPNTVSQDWDVAALRATVEEVDGSRRAQLTWQPGGTADELMHRLGLELQRLNSYPGDELFDATRIFTRLIHVLETAIDHSAAAGRGLGPVIEVLNDQWVLTSEGLECLDRPLQISASRLLGSSEGWPQYMRQQYWVDQDQFSEGFRIALAWHRRSRAGRPGAFPSER